MHLEMRLTQMYKYKKIVIGIDQSYKRTGVTVIADRSNILMLSSINFENCRNNSDKRNTIRTSLNTLLMKCKASAKEVVIVFERIRLQSQGFINIDYIKGIGALNTCIIDTAYNHGIDCYSVDTRCWKSQIVGSSKPLENNLGIDKEKYRTILFLLDRGLEKKILVTAGKQKKKGVIIKNGERYTYNDDAADSFCIALYGIHGDHSKLQKEH